MIRIGVDVGGTKTEIAALGADLATLYRRRQPTPAGDYDATIALVSRLVREAEDELGTQASVGVGAPGSPSPRSGLMRNANSTCLNGRSLKEDLERALAREIRLANDADCFALSEALDGAGRGARSVFGVILGTGVGGGIVVDGKLLAGPNAVAGEWGHNPLPWPNDGERPGPPCYCGRRGCIETYLSGPALARDHERATGESLAPADICARAAAGNAAAAASLGRYESRLARAMATVINVIDPEIVVFGGGLSNIPGLAERLPAGLRAWVFSDVVRTRFAGNAHGDASGVRGAALLWGG